VIGIIARSAFNSPNSLSEGQIALGDFCRACNLDRMDSREIVWALSARGIVYLVVTLAQPRASCQTASLLFRLGHTQFSERALRCCNSFSISPRPGCSCSEAAPVVPFLYGGVVQGHHWLTDHQFVDAVAVAMITPDRCDYGSLHRIPGGRVAGATAAALEYLPVYLVVVVLAPSLQTLAKNPQLNAFVRGVTAAATERSQAPVVVPPGVRSTTGHDSHLCHEPGCALSLEGSRADSDCVRAAVQGFYCGRELFAMVFFFLISIFSA